MLCSCYVFDLPYINKERWHNPARADLVNFCLPLVKDLEDSTDSELSAAENGKEGTTTTAAEPMEVEKTDTINGMVADDQKKRSKLILKTCKYKCKLVLVGALRSSVDCR